MEREEERQSERDGARDGERHVWETGRMSARTEALEIAGEGRHESTGLLQKKKKGECVVRCREWESGGLIRVRGEHTKWAWRAPRSRASRVQCYSTHQEKPGVSNLQETFFLSFFGIENPINDSEPKRLSRTVAHLLMMVDMFVLWSAKGALPKSISVPILTSNAWRTLGLFGAFPTLVGGHHWSWGATFLGSWGD